MKKGEILEGIVTRVDYPGKGVVETPEGLCIVKNVLPGQKVQLRVTKKRRGKAEGNLQQVIEKSPVERIAPCPHFGSCGGCMYLHLPFEEELALKRTQVERLLEGSMQEASRLSGIPEQDLRDPCSVPRFLLSLLFLCQKTDAFCHSRISEFFILDPVVDDRNFDHVLCPISRIVPFSSSSTRSFSVNAVVL